MLLTGNLVKVLTELSIIRVQRIKRLLQFTLARTSPCSHQSCTTVHCTRGRM